MSRAFDVQARAEIKARTTGCIYCGAHDELELDHVTPLSKGGTSDPGNGALACKRCNRSKSDKSMLDFLTVERCRRAREVHMLDAAIMIAGGNAEEPVQARKSMETTHNSFLAEIEAHLKVTGQSATSFGKQALNDPAFVFAMRDGKRDPRMSTMQRVREHMVDTSPDLTPFTGANGAATTATAPAEGEAA